MIVVGVVVVVVVVVGFVSLGAPRVKKDLKLFLGILESLIVVFSPVLPRLSSSATLIIFSPKFVWK